jgi:hypothetical protein
MSRAPGGSVTTSTRASEVGDVVGCDKDGLPTRSLGCPTATATKTSSLKSHRHSRLQGLQNTRLVWPPRDPGTSADS